MAKLILETAEEREIWRNALYFRMGQGMSVDGAHDAADVTVREWRARLPLKERPFVYGPNGTEPASDEPLSRSWSDMTEEERRRISPMIVRAPAEARLLERVRELEREVCNAHSELPVDAHGNTLAERAAFARRALNTTRAEAETLKEALNCLKARNADEQMLERAKELERELANVRHERDATARGLEAERRTATAKSEHYCRRIAELERDLAAMARQRDEAKNAVERVEVYDACGNRSYVQRVRSKQDLASVTAERDGLERELAFERGRLAEVGDALAPEPPKFEPAAQIARDVLCLRVQREAVGRDLIAHQREVEALKAALKDAEERERRARADMDVVLVSKEPNWTTGMTEQSRQVWVLRNSLLDARHDLQSAREALGGYNNPGGTVAEGIGRVTKECEEACLGLAKQARRGDELAAELAQVVKDREAAEKQFRAAEEYADAMKRDLDRERALAAQLRAELDTACQVRPDSKEDET